jgi:hypothetical protein
VSTTRANIELATIGWREWVALPEWGVPAMKAKVDSGARSSALHAFDIELSDRHGQGWADFVIHPWQSSDVDKVGVRAPLIGHRRVRSSSGLADTRPVVALVVQLAGQAWPIEVTLTRRDEMGFRMLIGRQALRHRFVIDPARSYLGGRPSREVRARNRGHR